MVKAKKVKEVDTSNLPVVYEKLEVRKLLGTHAIKAEFAKELLGWEEVEDSNYMLIDEAGKRVRCNHNMHNRPFDERHARRLAQDILNRRWADSRNGEEMTTNGETIIIGRHGNVLSGQHRLVGVVLAHQLWAGSGDPAHSQKNYWAKKWTEQPSIEALVVFGVDEGGRTTRTLDNVKPRTLADVLFADTTLFGNVKPNGRVKLTKMVDFAVKLLWDRTGVSDDAFTPCRTHSEALEFIERHPRLLKAVKHIWEEDKTEAKKTGKDTDPGKGTSSFSRGNISTYVPAGYAAGLLYLMAACKTDIDYYQNADERSEKRINFDMWSKACDFWVQVGKGVSADPNFRAFHYAIGNLADPKLGAGGSIREKIAVVIKAWHWYQKGDGLTDKRLQLAYKTMEEGDHRRVLDEPGLTFLGIDEGTAEDRNDGEEEEDAETERTDGVKVVKQSPEERRAEAEKVAAELKARRGKGAAEGEKNGTPAKPPKDKAEGKPENAKQRRERQKQEAKEADERAQAEAAAKADAGTETAADELPAVEEEEDPADYAAEEEVVGAGEEEEEVVEG